VVANRHVTKRLRSSSPTPFPIHKSRGEPELSTITYSQVHDHLLARPRSLTRKIHDHLLAGKKKSIICSRARTGSSPVYISDSSTGSKQARLWKNVNARIRELTKCHPLTLPQALTLRSPCGKPGRPLRGRYAGLRLAHPSHRDQRGFLTPRKQG
jgi:hypothetical protein